MKTLLGMVAAGLALAGCAAAPAPKSGEAAATASTVYVSRHLQKGVGDNPPLTAEGAANAERLAAMLSDKGIVAVYATPALRAVQTGTPLAQRLGLEVIRYDPRDMDALAALVAAEGGPVLVIGHSNTVPALVERFGGGPQPPMTEEEFGKLFVVAPDGTVEELQVR